MKLQFICAAVVVLACSACSTPAPTSTAATNDDVCDVVTPPTGSRVVYKVKCEEKKPAAVKPAG